MKQETRKILELLHSDVSCMCKSIPSPVSLSGNFHTHDGCEFFLLLNGNVKCYTEGYGQHMERGTLACIRPYGFHRVELLDRTRYDRIIINIKENTMRTLSGGNTDLFRFFSLNPAPILFARLSESELLWFEARAKELEQARRLRQYGDDILSDALLKELLVMINRYLVQEPASAPHPFMPPLVSKTFSYIDEHLTEDITLQQLSDYVHHNSTYISRCFKQVTGTTLQQYIIAKRLTLAQQYLRQGKSPSEACYLSGFHNYSNFSRTFLKYIGLSPRQYQLQSKRK